MTTKLKLYDYQEYLVDYVLQKRRCGLYLPMGRGKTLISLTAACKMLTDGSAHRVLIVAPPRVAKNVWLQEMERWDHLRGWRDRAVLAVGNATTREAAINSRAAITIIPRDSVAWVMDNYGSRWDTIIIDECQGFKSYASKRFRALARMASSAENVILLSGTPMPLETSDLWAQMYLIDRGERLGRNITTFRREFCQPTLYSTHVDYVIREDVRQQIYELVSDVTVSLDPPANMPEIIYKTELVELSERAMQQYQYLKRTGCIRWYVGAPTSSSTIAPTAAAKHQLMRQVASGAYYMTDTQNTDWVFVHSAKVWLLWNMLRSEQKKYLIAYHYIFERDMILEMLTKHLGNKNFATINQKNTIAHWNAGEIDYLIVHPASAGEGLNLQFGGHSVIWYGLPDNMGHYHQLNSRLHRPGQKHVVDVTHLVSKDTIDEDVMRNIARKTAEQQRFMDQIKLDEDLI